MKIVVAVAAGYLLLTTGYAHCQSGPARSMKVDIYRSVGNGQFAEIVVPAGTRISRALLGRDVNRAFPDLVQTSRAADATPGLLGGIYEKVMAQLGSQGYAIYEPSVSFTIQPAARDKRP